MLNKWRNINIINININSRLTVNANNYENYRESKFASNSINKTDSQLVIISKGL